MKTLALFACSLLMTSAAFADGDDAGFYVNSKLVNTPVLGEQLFAALIENQAKGTDENVVCYGGEYTDAIEMAEWATKKSVTFNVIDVYGEQSAPPLDLEVSNANGETVGAVVHACWFAPN